VIARSLPDAERVQAGLELLGSDAFTLRQGEAQALLEGPFPPAAALLGLYPDRDEIRALRFVHAYSGRGARVYVGVARHGQAYLASLRSYWILGRTPVVRDYFLLPGVTTRREVQERMAADLERHGVDWVVLWHGSGGDPDFARRGHVGSEFLDRQIESRYRLVVRFGSYGVYRLRAPVAPALRSGAAPESASERHQSKTVRLTSR
jgi:hypothetical protein